MQKPIAFVNALNLRARVLVLITGMTLVFFIADSAALQPAIHMQLSLLEDITDKERRLAVLQARSSTVFSGLTNNDKSVLYELESELNDFGRMLQTRLDSMLSPHDATTILEKVVSSHSGITLNTVNTKLTPLSIDYAEADNNFAFDNVRRYEIELQLEGGYLDTLDYLRALESLPWRFFWTDISFNITDYPTADIKLEIYTLGKMANLHYAY